MFSGIIQDLGRIGLTAELAKGRRLKIESAVALASLDLGESIAINGACMTVVESGSGWFSVDVSAESLRCTTLGEFEEGRRVNVERSMKLDALVGGHIVSGHVDAKGSVSAIKEEGESYIFTFSAPREQTRLLVEKGSVAVDGISLTCFNCGDLSFDVAIIPHTFSSTSLGLVKPSDAVNLENDVIGKYVAKLVDPYAGGR